MNASDAYRTAQALAANGLSDSDAATHADIDAAADYAGATRPATTADRNAVRIALDAIGAAK